MSPVVDRVARLEERLAELDTRNRADLEEVGQRLLELGDLLPRARRLLELSFGEEATRLEERVSSLESTRTAAIKRAIEEAECQ